MLNSKKASKLSNVAATQGSSKLKSDLIFSTSGGVLMLVDAMLVDAMLVDAELPPPERLTSPVIVQLMQSMARSVVLTDL